MNTENKTAENENVTKTKTAEELAAEKVLLQARLNEELEPNRQFVGNQLSLKFGVVPSKLY